MRHVKRWMLLALCCSAVSAEILPLDGAELRVPESYERVEAAAPGSLGTWRKRHPQEAGRPDDVLTIRTYGANKALEAQADWVDGIKFTGASIFDYVRERRGREVARVRAEVLPFEGVEMTHVTVLVPLKQSTIVLFVRGAAKHLIGLRRELEEMAVAMARSVEGARWFSLEALKTSIQIPPCYERRGKEAAGLPAEWSWSQAQKDGNPGSFSISLVPRAEYPGREWTEGRDYTWGNVANVRWHWRTGDIRVYEGHRFIEGRQELRIAVFVPFGENGIAIRARGPLEEQGRVRQCVDAMLESLGGVPEDLLLRGG